MRTLTGKDKEFIFNRSLVNVDKNQKF